MESASGTSGFSRTQATTKITVMHGFLFPNLTTCGFEFMIFYSSPFLIIHFAVRWPQNHSNLSFALIRALSGAYIVFKMISLFLQISKYFESFRSCSIFWQF